MDIKETTWEEQKMEFQSLLNRATLEKIIGEKIKPLFEGYILNFVSDENLGKSGIFIGTKSNPKSSDDFIMLDYNPLFDQKACKVCVALREAYGEAPCKDSDKTASREIIDYYNNNKENLLNHKKFKKNEFDLEKEDSGAITYFTYFCDVLELEEWIVPLFVDTPKKKICVGVFITGQITCESNAEQKAQEIKTKYPKIKNTPDIIKTDLQKVNPFTKEQKSAFFGKFSNIQNEIQLSFDNAFLRVEQTTLDSLRQRVWGKNSPYREATQGLDPQELKDIFNRFKLMRSHLFDSVISTSQLFGFKEFATFRARSRGTGLDENHDLPGAILTWEKEKSQENQLAYDRPFFESFFCLDASKIKSEMTEKDGQSNEIIVEGDNCRAYIVRNDEHYNRACTAVSNEAYTDFSCHFLNNQNNGNTDKLYCTFMDPQKKELNKPACMKDCKTKSVCPYLLTTSRKAEEIREQFNNCLLAIYATKSYAAYPVGFLIKFDDAVMHNGLLKQRFKESVLKFLEALAAVFLSQWNMLVAQFHQMIYNSSNVYTTHELNNVLSGMIGLKNKFSDNLHETSSANIYDLRKSYPNLPRPVIDLLEYLPFYLRDSEAFISILSNISANTTALTDDLEIKRKKFDLYDNILNRLQVLYNYYEARGTRRLICQGRYVDDIIPELFADAGKLEQAIDNLIKNAFKYSYEYTNIHVLRGLRNDNSDLYITVLSYGKNIPQEEWEKIFEMGNRGSDNVKDGKGLGLYIARKFAKKHGGDVILEEPKFLSKFNIPLVKGYLSEVPQKDRNADLEKECGKAYEDLTKEGIYHEVVNQLRPSNKVMAPLTPWDYVEFIKDSTYRIKFTLWIPLKGEDCL